MAKFADRLKKARTKAGMTQTEIAKVLGVTGERISEWERERRTPKPLTQEGILARLKKLKPRKRK